MTKYQKLNISLFKNIENLYFTLYSFAKDDNKNLNIKELINLLFDIFVEINYYDDDILIDKLFQMITKYLNDYININIVFIKRLFQKLLGFSNNIENKIYQKSYFDLLSRILIESLKFSQNNNNNFCDLLEEKIKKKDENSIKIFIITLSKTNLLIDSKYINIIMDYMSKQNLEKQNLILNCLFNILFTFYIKNDNIEKETSVKEYLINLPQKLFIQSFIQKITNDFLNKEKINKIDKNIILKIITLLNDFISNEKYNFNDSNDYIQLNELLKKILQKEELNTFFISKNEFCINFYLNYYKSFENIDISLLIENIIKINSEPFIFLFLKKFSEEFIFSSQSKKHLNFLVGNINIIYSTLNNNEINFSNVNKKDKNIGENIINLIILFEFLYYSDNKTYNIIFEDEQLEKILFDTIEMLIRTNLYLFPYCKKIYQRIKNKNKPKKLICEIVIDIYYNIICYKSQINNKDKIIKKLQSFIFKNDNYSTIFYYIDISRTGNEKKNNLKWKNILKYEKNMKKKQQFNVTEYMLGKLFIFNYKIFKEDNKEENLKKIFSNILKGLFNDSKKLRNSPIYFENKINSDLYNIVKDLIEKSSFCDEDYKKFENKINNNLKANNLISRIKYNEIYASECLLKNSEKKNEKEKILEKKEESNKKNENSNNNLKNNDINIFIIDENFNSSPLCYMTKDNNVFFQKNDLLLKCFSNQFSDIFFYNEKFKKMKSYYISHNDINPDTKLLDFPSEIKNYSKKYQPRLFLKQNFDFFKSEFFKISHPYFVDFEKKIKNKSILLKKKILNISKNIISYYSEYVNINDNLFGKIYFEEHFLIFKSEENIPQDLKFYFTEISTQPLKEKIIIIFYEEIEYVIERRFLFLWQAIEFYLKNGKSYYFNLYENKEMNEVMNELSKRKVKIKRKIDLEKKIENYLKKFENKEISTFKYLLKLNNFSSRSFNSLSTYPVFPWIINSIDPSFDLLKVLKNNSDNNYIRDFKYPINCQNIESKKAAINRYIYSDEKLFKNHQGINYSNPAYISYYLMRMYPFIIYQIKLQSNSMEQADRMFNSIKSTLNSLSKGVDNRELIPEIYSQIEIFINLNCIFFNKTGKKEIVDDLCIYSYNESFENSIAKYVKLISQFNTLMDSDYIYKLIVDWIDNVFGKNQLIEDEKLRKESCNIYQKYYYEEISVKKLNEFKLSNDRISDKEFKTIKDEVDIIINNAKNFGQIPYNILKKNCHKLKIEKEKEKENKEIEKNNFQEIKLNQNIELIYFTVFHFENNELLFTIERDNNNNLFLREHKTKNYIELFDVKFGGKKIYNEIIYIKNPKYFFTILINDIKEFSFKIITCKSIDNSIKLYFFNKAQIMEEKKEAIIYPANCIQKINEKEILLGCFNGKLLKYNVLDLSIKYVNSIQAHNSIINIIEINNNLNIIITSGDDHLISIRKLYDYTLLSLINLSYNLLCYEIKLSDLNILYCSCLIEEKAFIILNYTLNGLYISKSCSSFSNFYFYQNYLISLLDNSNIIFILNDYDLSIQNFGFLSNDFENNNNFKFFYYLNNSIYYVNNNKINFELFKIEEKCKKSLNNK